MALTEADSGRNNLDLAPRERASKIFCTLQARAALAGVVLHQLEGDDGRPLYVATRRVVTRQFCDLNAVGAWLDRIAGKLAAGIA